MTKNTCSFTLHLAGNIDVCNAENSISRPLDFTIFWGERPKAPLNRRNAGVSRNQGKLRHQLPHPGHELDLKAKDLIGHL